MPDDPSTAFGSGRAWVWRALWCFAVVLIGYPLSVGPAALLMKQGRVSEDILVVVYAPLEMIYDRSASAQHAFDWYLELWGVR